MKQTRREFVRVLFAAGQAAVAGPFLTGKLFGQTIATAPSAGALNFLVFGDWGRQGEFGQREVADRMGEAARQIGSRFVISVGDNFYENGVSSVTDDHWRKSFENVYTARSLDVPWHVILGNHDYRGNCEAQLEYAKLSSRWNMPARYYQQTHPLGDGVSADFFYLDTTPMIHAYRLDHFEEEMHHNVVTQDVPKQMAWFRNALAHSGAQWKIVIGHHPIYSGGKHGDTHELVANILPLLKEHGVQAYFNGHDHDLQHLVAGGQNFFCSGAGSKVRPAMETPRTKFAESGPGFVTVSLSPEKMDIGMIDYRGKRVYSTTVSRELAEVPAA